MCPCRAGRHYQQNLVTWTVTTQRLGANSCNKWTGGKCKSHLFITAIFIKIIRGSDFSAETGIEMTLQNVLHITELRVADPCGEPRRQRGDRVLPRPQLAADGGCSGALQLQDCTAAPLSNCTAAAALNTNSRVSLREIRKSED